MDNSTRIKRLESVTRVLITWLCNNEALPQHDAKCLLDRMDHEVTAAEEEEAQQVDLVNHPPHYTSHPSGVECIEITKHMMFMPGNAFKYVWRYGLKGGTQDLEKALWYMEEQAKGLSPVVDRRYPRSDIEDKLHLVLRHEPDSWVADALGNIWRADWDPAGARDAVSSLRALLAQNDVNV